MDFDPTYKDSQRKSTHGGKGRQVIDREDRLYDYRLFREEIPAPPYPSDIDFVEYRIIDGRVVPVGILEMTCMNFPPPHAAALEKFLGKVWHRWNHEDKQGDFAREMAQRLGCRPFLVVLEPGAEIFHITPLDSLHPKWIKFDRERYTRFVRALK